MCTTIKERFLVCSSRSFVFAQSHVWAMIAGEHEGWESRVETYRTTKQFQDLVVAWILIPPSEWLTDNDTNKIHTHQ